MKQLLLFCLFVFKFYSFGIAQSTSIKFEEFDLENGLHVILHQDNSTPIVAVTVLYHVGSKNEDPNRTGFAHFFEHLLFEGSENIQRGEFDKLIEKAGGTSNAYTTQDITFYHEVLPSNQFELGLYLESERMLHAKIEPIGVETQREVVKEEKRYRVDNKPYGSIFIEIFKRAFNKHPYRWTPIGSMDHIDKATLSEFIAFYNMYYVPNNAVLSIAGDISIMEAKKLIKEYFNEVPKSKKDVQRPKVASHFLKKEVRDTIYDNIQLPAVMQAYRIPPKGTKDAYALSMLTTLLADGKSSRLQKSLVDQQQKAMAVGAFPYALEHPGIFITYGIANIGVDVKEVDALIDDEITKLKSTFVNKDELQKIKNQVENDFINQNTTVAGIAENLAQYYLFYHDTNLINTELERYLKVTPEDIKRVAQKYLNEENRVVLYYLPNLTK